MALSDESLKAIRTVHHVSLDSEGPSGTVLPALHEHWSDLSEKTVAEALTFMEKKQRSVREVSVFGLSVPGELCLVVIPLAFALTHLQLFLHLRSCRLALTNRGNADDPHFPWLGFYDDTISTLLTLLSTTLVPAALTALLVIRYSRRLGDDFVPAASALTVAAVLLGFFAAVEAAKMRAYRRAA